MRCYQCDDYFEDDEIYCQCCFNGRGSRLAEAEERIKVLERQVKAFRDVITDLMADGANAILTTLEPTPKPERHLVPVNEALMKLHQERQAELDRAWGNSVPHKIPNGESVKP